MSTWSRFPRPDGFSDSRQGDMETLKARIRHIPDFPKPGILFYDITTLLNDPVGFREMIDALSVPFADKGIEQVVGIESRGFILGAAVANRLNAGFVPIRKPGKLPSKTRSEERRVGKESRFSSFYYYYSNYKFLCVISFKNFFYI